MTRLKALREALNIKQEEISILCGVTQSTVSLWESGKTVPRKSALKKLADRYGVTVGYLLGIDEKDEPDISQVDFALSGEIRDLSEAEKLDLLEYVRFKRAQKAKREEP